ncbi:MAG: tRNA epoxyqueuosine(34) reductase QueG [Synechococcales cyanobacterium]
MEILAETAAIKDLVLGHGFSKVGVASVSQPPNLGGLTAWIDAGYAADMAWMADPRRWDPWRVLPQAKTMIMVALNYYSSEAHVRDPEVGKISRYAWGRDYHRVLGKKLKAVCAALTQRYPGSHQRWYVDTGPVAEKPWAQQAGLGWIGKNGLLISREYGSWIFLGVILTTLDVVPDPPHTSHCGTCTRCLDACPTQAIVSPTVVDSRRCIAYHTLENHAETLPIPTHAWVAGCDICQDVCPWNQRFAQPTGDPDFHPYPGTVAPPLKTLATMTADDFDRQFPASALRRLKVSRLRRNARHALATIVEEAGIPDPSPPLDSE